MTAPDKAIAVLVADDHEDSLFALATLLRINGYTVLAARTTAEASALAASALASGKHCDLLVGDIQFPDGSGLDLMRDLRARYGLQGIAVSGWTGTQDVEAALEAGFDRHLPKPITFPDLLAAVRELTADRATGTRGRNESGRLDGGPAVPGG
jgi:CheY-like chemotaxis protein